MRFEWVREGPAEACRDRCREWISATGRIAVETPRDFEAFARTRDLRGATIVLDSNGGVALAGIALGRAFRRLGLTTTVGKTTLVLQPGDGQPLATLSPRAVFVDIVERIELSAMEGLDSRLAERPDWTSYVCDAEIARPAGADLLSDADERIVVRGPGLSDFPPSGLARIENRFLQVCGSSLFRESNSSAGST